MTKDKYMTIRITKPLRDAWTSYAKSEGITTTQLIESAVAQRMELGRTCSDIKINNYNNNY